MVVYITLIIWCICTAYLSQYGKAPNKSAKKLLALLPIVAIFVVSAIRYNVGTDYSGTYTSTYYQILHGNSATMTLIPTLIYKIIIKLGLDVQWFFVITSLLICYFTYKSIEDQSKSRWLSYYIFICGCCLFFGFNGIRQAVGMSMFYYSLKYLGIDRNKTIIDVYAEKQRKKRKRNWFQENSNAIKYFALNLVSTGFHITGVIFMPLYFFLKRRLRLKTKVIIVAVCLAFSSIILPLLIRLINTTRYSYYIANSSFFSQNSLNVSMYINILLLVCYEVIIHKKRKSVTDQDIIYGNIHFYGLIVTLFVTNIPMAYRIFYAFRYIEFLSIPNLISHCNRKYRTLITIGVAVVFFAYFVLMIGRNNSHDALPYLTIFDRK